MKHSVLPLPNTTTDHAITNSNLENFENTNTTLNCTRDTTFLAFHNWSKNLEGNSCLCTFIMSFFLFQKFILLLEYLWSQKHLKSLLNLPENELWDLTAHIFSEEKRWKPSGSMHSDANTPQISAIWKMECFFECTCVEMMVLIVAWKRVKAQLTVFPELQAKQSSFSPFLTHCQLSKKPSQTRAT